MKGVTVWFTGLPCSGKTTLALKLNAELKKRGYSPRGPWTATSPANT